MEIIETGQQETTRHATVENSKNCCGKCANKINSLNAHCGESYSIEELLKKGNQINDFDLNHLQVDALADYIYNEYHQYYYKQEPVLSELIKNIAAHPGTNYPVIHRLKVLFSNLKNVLQAHLLVEERMLFPHLKNLVHAKRDMSSTITSGVKYLAEPVRVLQDEHKAVEEILNEISLITNAYTPADYASESFVLLYKKLKGLHENLKQHIFIENKIFYPKAILLEEELKELVLL